MDARSRSNALVVPGLVALVVVGAVAVPLLGAIRTLGGGIAGTATVAVIALAVGVLVHGRAVWRAPILWFTVAFSVLFVARPMADRSLGDVERQFGISIGATYGRALGLCAVGLLAFVVGYLVAGGRPRRSLAPPDPPIEVVRARSRRAALVCGGLFLAFLALNGGPGLLLQFFRGRSVVTGTALQSSSGYLYTAPLWLYPLGLYIYLRERFAEPLPHRRRRPGFGIALMVASQIATVGVGDRSYFVPAALGFLVARQAARAKAPRVAAVLAVGAGLVVVGILLPLNYRANEVSGGRLGAAIEVTRDQLSSKPWLVPLQGQDTAMARNLAIEVGVIPQGVPYAKGRSYLAALARPVPRQVWPGKKPRSADEELNDVLLFRQLGIPAGFAFSFFGEPYYNGGLIGVVLVSALVGAVSRRFFEHTFRRGEPLRHSTLTLYAASLPMLIVYMRGGLGVDYQRHAFVTVPLIVVLALARAQAKRGRSRKAAYAGLVRSRSESRGVLVGQSSARSGSSHATPSSSAGS
ncbi:MAG: hypothetical protein QOE45_3073 [Frankiaceae bacterium]|nr:hypothetical protein [Frankiaceae bacterium]